MLRLSLWLTAVTLVATLYHGEVKAGDTPALQTLCGVTGVWRRVVNINMLDNFSICPTGLREVFNRSSGQRVCGRTVTRGGGCSSVKYRVRLTYTQVCGFARGYQYFSMDGFRTKINYESSTVNGIYADGLSITRGDPRVHLWTYVVGNQENGGIYACPTDVSSYNYNRIPGFLESHYYCETGFTSTMDPRIAWEDPLWDGAGCSITSHSCDRYGWFYRKIQPTNDFIELRLCTDEAQTNEDFFVDVAEIWVL